MPKKKIEKNKENEISHLHIDDRNMFEEILELFEDSRFDVDEAKLLKIQFNPEVAYVRRTSQEFYEGTAVPLKPGEGSHRMVRTAVMLSPEMKLALETVAKQAGLDQMKTIRAALRYAFRNMDDFDPQKELRSDFTLEIEPPTKQNQ